MTETNDSTREEIVPLGPLPVTATVKDKKGGIFFILFGLVWGGVPTAGMVSEILSGTMKPEMYLALIFTVIGLGIILLGLSTLVERKVITIDKQFVDLWHKKLFGATAWNEPLANFRGVIMKEKLHRGSKNRRSFTEYYIELVHDDEAKRLKLFSNRKQMGMRTTWIEYAKMFDLPLLEDHNGTLVACTVDDLDKSVRELAQEEKLEVHFDPSQQPPEGLACRIDGDALEIRLEGDRTSIIGALLVVLFPAIFIYVGFFLKNGPIVFGVVGILFELLFLYGVIVSLISTTIIRLQPDRVRIYKESRYGTSKGTTLRAEDIQSVTLASPNDQRQQGVVLATRARKEVIGSGLTSEAQTWLKDCILYVVTT